DFSMFKKFPVDIFGDEEVIEECIEKNNVNIEIYEYNNNKYEILYSKTLNKKFRTVYMLAVKADVTDDDEGPSSTENERIDHLIGIYNIKTLLGKQISKSHTPKHYCNICRI